uniref:Regulator of microtubule dynamics protein 1 n=1 Tax=Parascaris univalens TaxID=6257 RepID=A0A915B5A8_PARUN
MDFAELDKLIDIEPEKAYEKIKEMFDKDESAKTNVQLLWRIAKACFLWGNSMQRKNPKRKQLIYEGRTYAKTAYSLDESNFEALRWTAVLVGSATDYMGPKERAEQGNAFKDYLDKALAVDPKEFTLLHLRGRFTFEVATLSWIEKKVCNALFSVLPDATIDMALEDFLEADRNVPFVWAENLLYLARCYSLKKEKANAQKYMDMVERVEKKDEMVIESMAEIKALIAKCK